MQEKLILKRKDFILKYNFSNTSTFLYALYILTFNLNISFP